MHVSLVCELLLLWESDERVRLVVRKQVELEFTATRATIVSCVCIESVAISATNCL